MNNTELDARIEIAKAFLHEFVDRRLEHKRCGPQSSEEWLRATGFYNESAIIPSPRLNKWRQALGLPPLPKEYRYYHNGKVLPMHVRTMNHEQFTEYRALLEQLEQQSA